MRVGISFFFLIISGVVWGQTDSLSSWSTKLNSKNHPINTSIHRYYNPTIAHYGDESDIQINLISDLSASSNNLSSAFIQRLLLGGMIDEPLKDKASDLLVDDNQSGFDWVNATWFNTSLGDSSPYRLHLGIQYQTHRGIAYTPDLYTVAFYGNKSFAGQDAILDNSQYNGFVWMGYKAALSRQYSSEYGLFTASIGAGFLQGLSGEELNIYNGNLFTSENGAYLDLEYNFRYQNAGSGAVRIDKTRGTGWVGDLFFSWQNPKQNLTANLTVADFGVIQWNVEAYEYSGDSSIRFEGIDITELLISGTDAALGDGIILLEILDVDSVSTEFTSSIPMRVDANISYETENGYLLTAGTFTRVQTVYNPLFYLRAGKYVLPETYLSLIASYGGYGGLGIGIDFQQQLGPYISVHAGSSSLLGFVAPESFNAASAYAAIRIAFNR